MSRVMLVPVRMPGSKELLLVASLMVCQTACRTQSAPSDPYVGSWSGRATDDVAGTGTVHVTISDQITAPGSWRWQGGPGTTGTLLGAPAVPGDARRHFTLRCDAAGGGGAGLMSVSIAGSVMSGTYFLAGCSGISRGTLQLTRR